MSLSERRYRAAVSSVCLLLASCAAAFCQQQAARVAGTVVVEGSGSAAGLTAELCDSLGDRVVNRVAVSPAGDFEFGGVPAGEYRLRIAGWGGGILAQRIVSAGSGREPLEIRVNGSREAPRIPGKVSLAQLQHHIPSRAARELSRETEAFRAGDLQSSIAHLRKAIQIDPGCTEAHNNLGVRYMAQNRVQEAAAEFRTAATLDPGSEKAFANLASALFLLGQLEEAGVAARRALALDSTCSPAHYVLGRVMANEAGNDEAALREFERAAPEIPAGRLAAARILAQHGERERAAAYLRLYLGTANPRDRAALEAWLARLEEGTTR